MKLNKIMLLFLLVLPLSISLRILQLYFTIDASTGFYLEGSETYGRIILILILLFVLCLAVFSRLAFKRPDNLPNHNIVVSISSFLLAGAIAYETFFQKVMQSTVVWQLMLLKLCGTAAIAFFVLFAITPILKIELPKITTIIPVTYLIIKIVYDFTSISKLALISDNIIIIFVYCVTLLFFLNFAKLYNNVDKEKNFKKILSYGLTSSTLCFINSIPYIVINTITEKNYIHISVSTNLSILFFGIFILCFAITYFFQKENQNGKNK